MARPLILIVEDERSIAELLEFNLQNEGYACRSFGSGRELFAALQEVKSSPVSLFILDIMLPDMDGFEICRRLRADEAFTQSAVLMLTARSSEDDKVRGLESGADDYLTKPFGIREFLARVRALLRRSSRQSQNGENPAGLSAPDTARFAASFAASSQETSPGSASGAAAFTAEEERRSQIACGDLLLDDARHLVFKGEEELEMTNREYELLKFLMLHRGNAYSRDDLLNYVWGYDYSGETRTVDVHIRQLRRKIEDNSSQPDFIETVRGYGYRFRDVD